MSVLGIYRVLPKSQPLLCDSPGSWLKWPSVHRSVGQCHLLAGSVSPSPGLDAGCLSRLPGTAGDAASCPACRSCLCGGHLFRLSFPLWRNLSFLRGRQGSICAALLNVPCSLSALRAGGRWNARSLCPSRALPPSPPPTGCGRTEGFGPSLSLGASIFPFFSCQRQIVGFACWK